MQHKPVQKRFTGTAAGEVFDPRSVYRAEDFPVLHTRGGSFTVLNITDIHYSDKDIRFFMSFPAQRTVRRIIRTVKPDLITVTGDIVCGRYTHRSIARFTRFMESFNTPWAPVFGNHDDEGDCDLSYLADVMMSGAHCLMKKGDPAMGTGNYIVNIEDGGTITNSLIMAYTGNAHLNPAQLDWYEWAVRGIGSVCGHTVPCTVFFHIPSAQYQYVCDTAWDAKRRTWRSGFGAAGEVNEKICCPRKKDGTPADNGFFDRVLRAGATHDIICGHEHMNNFSAVYEGIRLTYTLKVGKGSGFQPGFNGASKIILDDFGVCSITHIYDNKGTLTEQVITDRRQLAGYKAT